jgi:ABC-type glycerol-3-phosphate transport system substrate-binding protein
MKLTVLVLVSLLVATSASAQSPAPALAASPRVTMKVVDAPFEDVVVSVGQTTGITVQWDEAVSSEAKSRRVPSISFVNAPAEDAVAMLVRFAGLAYTVIDTKTVRITLPAR